MSHIATLVQEQNPAACHYYGQAFSVAKFYVLPMALRIKELRKEKGWTQDHLASLAGVSRSQLAMIESETRPANTLRLNAIAAALGVRTESLFDSGDESARIIELIRLLSPEDRETLVRLAEALAAKSQ